MQKGLDYELIDFGQGKKLERFGSIVLIRPEILVEKKSKANPKAWAGAHAEFKPIDKLKGEWKFLKKFDPNWPISYSHKDLVWSADLKFGPYKHVGIFPEQEQHWNFLASKVKSHHKVMNLFGYTGCASLTAAMTGGDVFHVDSSKSVVNWSASNARKNDVNDIHWVVEDAMAFAEKEARRNRRYDFIIMDPPVFGRGKKGEKWRIEKRLPELVEVTHSILAPRGTLIFNTYSPTVTLGDMAELCKAHKMKVLDQGMLGLQASDGRRLSLSNYVVAQK